MHKKSFTFPYLEFDSEQDLPGQDRDLLRKAREAVSGSYAPYSNYHVGAALLLENGLTVTGSNQENMAFPSGLCAERVAIAAVASAYPETAIRSIAITAKGNSYITDKPVTPCGSCRQVMLEREMTGKAKIRVIMSGEKGKILVVEGIENLLPFSFLEERLKK